jgi:hypothetical protein
MLSGTVNLSHSLLSSLSGTSVENYSARGHHSNFGDGHIQTQWPAIRKEMSLFHTLLFNKTNHVSLRHLLLAEIPASYLGLLG